MIMKIMRTGIYFCIEFRVANPLAVVKTNLYRSR